ncbi:MAG: flagellar biosynthetic protein FliO [Planctomycetaceae bacterium]|nr:flagellar biosynthetic protein FliO [Planctomycetaceae bacterium]
MRNPQFYEMPLREGIFSLAVFACSHALLHAGEVDPKTHFPSDFPAVSLSLEETSETQPSGTSNALSFGSEMAFDWKAWAVVGVAGAVLVGIRLFSRQAVFKIPSDVFELLGESTLGGGQAVRIVRFGPKTLLVSVGSGGPKTLSELDDPLATEWIAAACRGEQTLRPLAGRLSVGNDSQDGSGSQVSETGSTPHSEVA